ncbi:HNH endonuclease [Pseudoxanthomonas sp. JBR18]|uniref:HNH endonuclease n=1 Tax=Pseudoxanthomonas sp. JBR18 TaxID=2969308 RepID=UPI00230533EA|nr:HNH endonuclease [Pseudoxanthomonas sp. JBR18]WCE04457.1 HNH endonuclease [Pseudoxanthomonas sp. JBR18]
MSADQFCRPVSGFPGYFVTDAGQIVSCRGGTPRLLVWSIKSTGYPAVSLCRLGDTLTKSVHSLVADAFLGPRPEGYVCRHLDGNPQNPSVNNLAYGTPAENEADKERHGRRVRGEQVHGSRLTAADVAEIRDLYAKGVQYSELLIRWPINPANMHAAVHGYTWKHIPVPDYSCRKTIYRDGHHNRGQRHGMAKLTEADACKAIEMIASGMKSDAIAADLGVSRQTIAHIAAGRTWAHLPRPAALRATACMAAKARLHIGGCRH